MSQDESRTNPGRRALGASDTLRVLVPGDWTLAATPVSRVPAEMIAAAASPDVGVDVSALRSQVCLELEREEHGSRVVLHLYLDPDQAAAFAAKMLEATAIARASEARRR